MDALDFNVKLTPQQVIDYLDQGIIGGSATGERIDSYYVEDGDGHTFIVAVYEKHYYRAGNRLTLTVCAENMRGYTHVHAAGGGGGEGIFRFDWGAASSFTNSAYDILADFVVD